MKKLPSQYTTEELLEIYHSLEDTPELDKEAELDNADHVIPFVSNYKITPGDHPVSKKLLYKLFQTFSDSDMSKKEFVTKLKTFVEDNNSEFFYINQDQFVITQTIYKEEKKRDLTRSRSYQKHFQWFLDVQKLEPGLKWVEGFILFYIYKQTCIQRKVRARLGYKNFHNFLKLHFKYKRVNENRSLWFQIDENNYNLLTEEEKEVIRDARKKTGRS